MTAKFIGSIFFLGLLLLVLLSPDLIRAATNNTVTIIKSGDGQGKVVSTPAGLDCGDICSKIFDSNTVLTLKAEPSPGSEFVGWGEACDSKVGATCTVVLNSDKSVGAVFKALVHGVDLVITDVEIVDSIPSGGPVPIVGDIALSGKLTIKNRGDTPAVFRPETRDVYVGTVNGLPTDPKADLIAGLSMGTGTLTISPGESKIFDFNTTQDSRHREVGGYLGSEGEKTLYFMVDRNNAIEEVDKTNNIFTKKIIVMGIGGAKIYFSVMGNSHPSQIIKPGQKSVRFLEFFMGNGVGEVTVNSFIVGLADYQNNQYKDFVHNVRLVDSFTGEQLGSVLQNLEWSKSGVYGEVKLYKPITANSSTQKTISIMADIGLQASGTNRLGLQDVKFKNTRPEVVSLPVYDGSFTISQFSMLCQDKETVTESPLRNNEFALQSLNISKHPEILRYRIKLSSKRWSRWYVAGSADIDKIKNKDGTRRRMWAYFGTKEHQIERCKIPSGPKPDFTIKNFKVNYLPGWTSDVMVEYDVVNIGAVKTDSNFWVTIRNLSTSLILREEEYSGSYFLPNEPHTQKWAGKVGQGLIKGDNKIEITLDTYNNIYESNKGNNRLVQVVKS